MRNIALTGKKRVGKDTVADVLVKEYGYVRVAFADELKRMALEIDPIVGSDDDTLVSPGERLSEVVDYWGWERTKDQWPDVRRFLQNLGSSIRKRDPEFWIRAAESAMEQAWDVGSPVVVTDCRYKNEADALRNYGFSLVRITRPGLDDSDTHESETEMDGYDVDREIVNDGTLGMLQMHADYLAL